jgi:hypothetical protein
MEDGPSKEGSRGFRPFFNVQLHSSLRVVKYQRLALCVFDTCPLEPFSASNDVSRMAQYLLIAAMLCC